MHNIPRGNLYQAIEIGRAQVDKDIEHATHLGYIFFAVATLCEGELLSAIGIQIEYQRSLGIYSREYTERCND